MINVEFVFVIVGGWSEKAWYDGEKTHWQVWKVKFCWNGEGIICVYSLNFENVIIIFLSLILTLQNGPCLLCVF